MPTAADARAVGAHAELHLVVSPCTISTVSIGHAEPVGDSCANVVS